MKIVYNTDQIYLHGGIEKVMATKVNYFADLPDTEVYVVTTEQQEKKPCYPLDERIKLIDLEINYNRSKSYLSAENLKKVFKHYRLQKKIFKKLNPDVIISPNYNFDFYWLPFMVKTAKKIKEIHSSRYDWKPTKKNKLNAWFESKYDAIVVLNQDEATYFSSDNVVVIPNPVEINDLQCALDKKQVLAAGRIAPIKGFDQLIEAWKKVNRQFPDWQLHIYGQDYSGTQKHLEEIIRENDLDKIILFKGSVNDMTKTMSDYSLYAMSSVSECFPTVLLEALSVGLPVVSYDCPNGPRHIITHGRDGLLVENQNPEKLAEGLLKLIGNEKLRKSFGQNAKQSSFRFEKNRIMKKWITLLEGLKEKKD